MSRAITQGKPVLRLVANVFKGGTFVRNSALAQQIAGYDLPVVIAKATAIVNVSRALTASILPSKYKIYN